ncbi:MAG TPA: M20/M25/M40 family metallo-hydrolase [Candidatus Udaeobacter sp.]|nr:M20/M25/M40 family metallo-hydrolase [Candidatus Udaeobacter sp.]
MRVHRGVLPGLILISLLPRPLAAAGLSSFSPRIANDSQVQAAFSWIDAHRAEQVREWIHITEIPAPSRLEANRAHYVEDALRAAGLDSVRRDSIGNVIAVLKGVANGPSVIFASHMDTVFPLETPIHVRAAGDTLYAPGVGDNSASCANTLQAIRALRAAHLMFRGDLIFVFTVQEELGLRGMRWYLTHERRPDQLVALDGAMGDVNYGALGIRWYKFHYTGPGAHTMNSRGRPNPALAVARAIRDLSTIELSDSSSGAQAVLNISMIGGGSVVNAVSQDSWFTVDLRTVEPAAFAKLDRELSERAESAARAERTGFEREILLDMPAGGTEAQLADRRANPIVQTGVDVLSFLLHDHWPNQQVHAAATGSTDGNVGVAMGIPTIALGRTFGRDQHTLEEAAEIEGTAVGTKQIVLLAACLAGIAVE